MASQLFLCQPDKYGMLTPFLQKFEFEDYDHLDDSYYCDSDDDEDYKVTNIHETVKRFLRQVRESGGYDVDCAPPRWFSSPFTPRMLSKEINPEFYDEVMNLTQFAIGKINAEINKNYELVKVEKVVETRNYMMLLTFTAKEVVADANADGATAVKTFQGMIYEPLGRDPELKEWRFKPGPDVEKQLVEEDGKKDPAALKVDTSKKKMEATGFDIESSMNKRSKMM